MKTLNELNDEYIYNKNKTDVKLVKEENDSIELVGISEALNLFIINELCKQLIKYFKRFMKENDISEYELKELLDIIDIKKLK